MIIENALVNAMLWKELAQQSIQKEGIQNAISKFSSILKRFRKPHIFLLKLSGLCKAFTFHILIGITWKMFNWIAQRFMTS